MSESADTGHQFLRNLRLMGFVEGVSTMILFGVAMPLKYMADLPIAVRIAGSVHGLLFVCLVVMLMMATIKVPISKALALAGMLAAVVPFGPFVFDRWLVRSAEASID
jgi:integral membrane protein